MRGIGVGVGEELLPAMSSCGGGNATGAAKGIGLGTGTGWMLGDGIVVES